jgi:hypothetical protein
VKSYGGSVSKLVDGKAALVQVAALGVIWARAAIVSKVNVSTMQRRTDRRFIVARVTRVLAKAVFHDSALSHGQYERTGAGGQLTLLLLLP